VKQLTPGSAGVVESAELSTSDPKAMDLNSAAASTRKNCGKISPRSQQL